MKKLLIGILLITTLAFAQEPTAKRRINAGGISYDFPVYEEKKGKKIEMYVESHTLNQLQGQLADIQSKLNDISSKKVKKVDIPYIGEGYEFPVYEQMKDENGSLIDVEVNVERHTLADLQEKSQKIQAKIQAIDKLEGI